LPDYKVTINEYLLSSFSSFVALCSVYAICGLCCRQFFQYLVGHSCYGDMSVSL